MDDKTLKELAMLLMQGKNSNVRIGKQFNIFGNHNIINEKTEEDNNEETLPSPEKMASIIEDTISKGMWWGNTSWSVVFRIMQIKGYKGTISQFVREVENWPFKKEIPYVCNDDSISKPLRRGNIVRELEFWEQDGAPQQYCKLGLALSESINSCKE